MKASMISEVDNKGYVTFYNRLLNGLLQPYRKIYIGNNKYDGINKYPVKSK